jgi:hypothetical protein
MRDVVAEGEKTGDGRWIYSDTFKRPPLSPTDCHTKRILIGNRLVFSVKGRICWTQINAGYKGTSSRADSFCGYPLFVQLSYGHMLPPLKAKGS